MSSFTFIVTVETEREQGLIASRDEQSEKIIEEIESALESLTIGSIGGRGDSEYYVSEVDVEEVVTKDRKKEIEEYERRVVVATPGKSVLVEDLKAARRDLAVMSTKLAEQTETIAQLKANTQKSRVSQRLTPLGRDFRYLDESPVIFDLGDSRSISVSICRQAEDMLEIREGGVGRISIIPQASNYFLVKVAER